jgi:uncharacterized membrane protein
MPFCVQCGSQVRAEDPFCGACGVRQGAGPAPPPPPGPQAAASKAADPVNDWLKDLPTGKASLFCYIPFVGWIFAIVVLASARFHEDRKVRFHAFQGIYLFVLWLFTEWVFSPMVHGLGDIFFASRLLSVGFHALQICIIGAWIFMLVKTSHGEDYRLPLLGELAEKSVAEQK